MQTPVCNFSAVAVPGGWLGGADDGDDDGSRNSRLYNIAKGNAHQVIMKGIIKYPGMHIYKGGGRS